MTVEELTREQALADLWAAGPGAICGDCGHFAARHQDDGCPGMDGDGCRFNCGGFQWHGYRFTMHAGAGPAEGRDRYGNA